MWTESIFISDERVSIAPDNSDKLSEAVAVLEATGTLGDQVKALCGYIDKGVLPRVLKGGALLQSDAVVLGSGNVGLDGLRTLLTYVTDRLPDATRVYLHRYFSAPLARHLTETYLPSQLPLELQSGSRLQRLLEQVRSTEAFLGELGLLHDSDLRDFSTNLPNVWLIKYRDTHLADLRQRMLGWLGETEAVTLEEHVSGADLMQESGELQRAPQKNLAESAAVKPQTPSDEDAWNDDAWDVQDEQETDLAEAKKNVGVDANADEDAWGWGDEDDGGDIGNQTTQGPPTLSTTSTDQITLVDRFTVSTLPKCVLETITRVAADGDQLLTKYAGSPVAPAAAHFSEVIDTLVSLYLASVPHLQRTIGYPRMLTYNDCKWLSSKMAKIAEEVSSSVKEFGEHVYMVEIDERREALLAILAKAEGFVACTSPQQRETCDRVLQEVLDAIDRLHERWAVQLGQTTLLTALGTLCEACIASFTADVMSMTDISEQESTALAQLGDRLASVDKLFVSPASSPGEEPVALPAAWIPSWFRFRYVLDILEANLADITSFYHDGHLSDFAPHELADLVRALFADSDKRKKLLSELGS
ncbi:ribosome bioproteinsis protein ytm1 [Savitreella phatthalungensis]